MRSRSACSRSCFARRARLALSLGWLALALSLGVPVRAPRRARRALAFGALVRARARRACARALARCANDHALAWRTRAFDARPACSCLCSLLGVLVLAPSLGVRVLALSFGVLARALSLGVLCRGIRFFKIEFLWILFRGKTWRFGILDLSTGAAKSAARMSLDVPAVCIHTSYQITFLSIVARYRPFPWSPHVGSQAILAADPKILARETRSQRLLMRCGLPRPLRFSTCAASADVASLRVTVFK